jgi:putative DNA methylase
MTPPTTYRKKLIEVALPLEAINAASAREKSIRHGHPSTLHLWWARRPLAACRAVLFASMVDDPGSLPEDFPTEAAQEAERQRLFKIIENLVLWENSNNEQVLHAARIEIARSAARNHGAILPADITPDQVAEVLRRYAPPVLDPFAGGGSIPLEAQRLGLEAHASDLNPVAVLINKALIEIPPKFAGRPPVNPEARQNLVDGDWRGARGLAADVRYYGRWIRDEAFKRIGYLYPKVTLPKEYGGGEATVIAWLWARTVKCPNPACGAQMPLLTSFILSTKKGRETYLVPEITNHNLTFDITKTPPDGYRSPQKGMKRGMSGIFECIFCGETTKRDYVATEGMAKRFGAIQTAVVVEGSKGRIYLPASASVVPLDVPETDTTGLNCELSPNPRDVWCRNFGLNTPADLFTPRQLVALTTFSDLVSEARIRVMGDGGNEAYADAIATFLAMGVDRNADRNSTICSWDSSPKMEALRNTFARQALPMTWDYAEGNIFSDSSGNWMNNVEWIAKVIDNYQGLAKGNRVKQLDATASINGNINPLISTDPPYYDNIGYADLSDFFYVWLRRSLRIVYPDLFSTLLTPKDTELVATAYRFGGSKQKAEEHFETGLGQTFALMRSKTCDYYPLTVYYAFKQHEEDTEIVASNGNSAVASTGWETMLEAMIKAGFVVDGTWPIRTEMANRSVGQGTNALASSIVLVCRPRPEDAPLATRRDLLNALRRELPYALRDLQHGNIAPVDFAQAAIGPGMAVYSRYRQVVEADGKRLPVRTALQIINQELDRVLSEQESEYDAETRFAVAWFEQFQHGEGPYGDAETLARAKDTAVVRMAEAGVVEARAGKVRLLRRDELPANWQPDAHSRLTVWSITQHLIRALQDGGDIKASAVLRKVGSLGDIARDLAYRLYATCERKGWAADALAYNSLVTAWPELQHQSANAAGDIVQTGLFD